MPGDVSIFNVMRWAHFLVWFMRDTNSSQKLIFVSFCAKWLWYPAEYTQSLHSSNGVFLSWFEASCCFRQDFTLNRQRPSARFPDCAAGKPTRGSWSTRWPTGCAITVGRLCIDYAFASVIFLFMFVSCFGLLLRLALGKSIWAKARISWWWESWPAASVYGTSMTGGNTLNSSSWVTFLFTIPNVGSRISYWPTFW